MKKNITLSDIAGYATERTVWQLILHLCCEYPSGKLTGISPCRIIVGDNGFEMKDVKTLIAQNEKAFMAPENFGKDIESSLEQSDVWTLGALAFYAVTGMNVLEGKGGETQTDKTEIPRLSSSHVGKELSTLIHRCLSYHPKNRPDKEGICRTACSFLDCPVVPRKKLTSHGGKTYSDSLVKFWPEEMVPIILGCLMMLSSLNVRAQVNGGFDRTELPNEMINLVLRCTDLRLAKNVKRVSGAMDRDMNWTMMDELPLDKSGECRTTDPVDIFGLNDLGFSILKRHGGVTNAGGRFRDGRDPRYKYSFIEITVRKNATVTYKISGREGMQIFAIVPFEKNAEFVASIPDGESFTDNGIYYIRLKQGIKKSDSFTLTVKNNSGKNMAFALINYNSRNHE